MTHTNKVMSSVAAGVVGAVVGAAVGAGAVVLSEEKNRKAIGKKVTEVKDKVSGMATKVFDQGQKKVAEAKEAVKSKL